MTERETKVTKEGEIWLLQRAGERERDREREGDIGREGEIARERAQSICRWLTVKPI